MGVGKTATCRHLQKLLPNCVFLDGDWCWDSSPFVVTAETKAMVLDNIAHLLRNFLACSAYEHILFCWVLHEQAILDDLLARLPIQGFRARSFSLTCSVQALQGRLQADIDAGLRAPDCLTRSIARLPLYARLNTETLDTSDLAVSQAAECLYSQITS